MSDMKATENWGMLGHAWAVEMLRQQIQHNAVRHAYLITGPAGVGRRTLALRFIQALSCPSPLAAGEPCRNCKTCRQIEKMQFPDMAVVQAEKAGRDLRVEQVRSIQYDLSLKPLVGEHRFALFLRFHEANTNAANALLKTLEEAPARSILLLTADDAEGLPATIVSRCEVLRLKPLPIEMIKADLMQRGATTEQAELIAHLSGGRPGVAINLLSDSETLELRTEHLNELQQLLRASRIQKFATADRMTKEKDKEKVRDRLRLLLETWLAYTRDVMICASHAQKVPLVHIDRQEEIRSLADRIGLGNARRLVLRIEKALMQLDRNVNTRLLMEVLFLDLPKIRE